MQPDTNLLLSSRFYAYARGTQPWGLPNHLFSDAPHMVVLFDRLLCDEKAFYAEHLAHKELDWVISGLFVRLKEEGILVTANTGNIVRQARKAPSRLRIPELDSYYALHVQKQLGYPIFDWAGKIASTARTLAPSGTSAHSRKSGAILKLSYLWSVIAKPSQVVPPLNTLSGEAGSAYKQVLKLQEPHWRRLERCEVDIEEYTLELTNFKYLYKKIDDPIRSAAQRNLDELLRLRDRTARARERIAPLILEAFDDAKELPAYATMVQTELAKAVPSLFPAVRTATGKCVFGMATIAGPWLAKWFGYDLPGPETVGIPLGGAAITSAVKDLRNRFEERRAANPLRFMVATARKLRLGA